MQLCRSRGLYAPKGVQQLMRYVIHESDWLEKECFSINDPWIPGTLVMKRTKIFLQLHINLLSPLALSKLSHASISNVKRISED